MNVSDECYIPLCALISLYLRLHPYGFLPFEILELCDLDQSPNGVECLILFRSEVVPTSPSGSGMLFKTCNVFSAMLYIFKELEIGSVLSVVDLFLPLIFFLPRFAFYSWIERIPSFEFRVSVSFFKFPAARISRLAFFSVISLIGSTFAIGSTIYRFYLRRTRLWVDDVRFRIAQLHL